VDVDAALATPPIGRMATAIIEINANRAAIKR
jgi:hypothetical protein